VNTENLTFFHGTGVAAAHAILTSGSRDSLFEEIGACALGREILQALMEHARLKPDEGWRLGSVFQGPGSEYSSLWGPVLRQLDQPEALSVWEFGHFFVTANIANAYRYAIGNPYRSEFIRALAESLMVLNAVGHSLPLTVADRFPRVAHAINNPSSPVVLKLRGICRERLKTERGDNNIDVDLQSILDMMVDPGVRAPAAFRVRDVSAADIVAVHDLSNWPASDVHDSAWRPEPSNVAAGRRSVQDWLAEMPVK
jgi:hypothetical protein